MAEIVNLRRARKQKARVEKEDRAAENRRRHGLTLTERKVEDAARDKAARHVDNHRREPDS